MPANTLHTRTYLMTIKNLKIYPGSGTRPVLIDIIPRYLHWSERQVGGDEISRFSSEEGEEGVWNQQHK